MKINFARLKAQLLTVLLAASTTFAAEWRRDVIDSSGVGKYSSLKIDTHGNAHVSYLDETQLLLKYSFWDRALNKWFTTILDKSAGFSSLVLDSNQRPHISYIEYGAHLKYVRWDGAAWKQQAIPIKAKDISYYTSIALDSEGNPNISYYEYWGTGSDYRLNLRNVVSNGRYWAVRTVDSTPGSGKFNFAVSGPAGKPHVAYCNVKDENVSLRYARWDGESWKPELIETAPQGAPYAPQSVALALDESATPHISYTDVVGRLVKYATRVGENWKVQVVDAVREAAYPDRNGIAVDEQGNPYISYYDTGLGVLKLAWRKDGKWFSEVVDENFAGFTSSLQIHRGTIWITYADESSQSLKCARRPLDASNLSRVSKAKPENQ